MEIEGTAGAESSSRIVPFTVALPSVAFPGAESVTASVSFPSTSMSPMMGTITFCVVTPGAKVSVPVVVAKSTPSIAVPALVA